MNTPKTTLPKILTDGLEAKIHGSATLPYAVYMGYIPEYLLSYPLHYHPELEIIYCESGVGLITVFGVTYEINSGEFAIIMPDTVHSIEAKENKFHYYNILFKFSLLENTSEANAVYKKYLQPFENGHLKTDVIALKNSTLNKLLTPHIFPLIKYRHHENIMLLKSNLYAIMGILYQHAVPVENLTTSEHKANECLKKALTYVELYYQNPITIDEIADYCGYSSSHFMKLFHALTGSSFNQYLIHFRLQKAETLLRVSDENILQTALSCGFSNASYFTRAFQKQYHMSPSAYRNSERKPTPYS